LGIQFIPREIGDGVDVQSDQRVDVEFIVSVDAATSSSRSTHVKEVAV
jgi:hypothetical protein